MCVFPKFGLSGFTFSPLCEYLFSRGASITFTACVAARDVGILEKRMKMRIICVFKFYVRCVLVVLKEYTKLPKS